MTYSIKALSRITGIPPNTLRSWERRYGIPSPARDDAGFRLYSPQDASHLSLISRFISSGHSIGKLAAMSVAELEALDSVAAVTTAQSVGRDHLVQRVLEAVRACDVKSYRQLLSHAIVMLSPVEAASQIISPAMQEVGALWEQGKISVAGEHAITAITRQILFASINAMQWSAIRQPLAFATLPGDNHEMGLLIGYYIASMRGHQCTYLGPNVPIDALIDTVKLAEARVLVLSCVYQDDETIAIEQLQQVAVKAGGGLQIWVGSSMNLVAPGLERLVKFSTFDHFYEHLNAQR